MAQTADQAIDQIDLAEPDLYAHGRPEEVWAQLRAERPVYWNARPDGSAFWAVTRYHDAQRVLKDAETFRSANGMRLDDDSAATAAASGKLLIVTDGSRHTGVRRLLSSAFTPRTAFRLEQTMRETVRAELQPLLAGQKCEFTDVASVLPVSVVCDLLGVPKADWIFMLQCTRKAFGESAVDPIDRMSAHAELFEYYEDLLAERRKCPRDDLISVMAHGVVHGEPLTDEEILFNCDGLISGGNETTRHATVGGLLALIRDPSQWPGDFSDARLDSLVSEILRYTSPALHVLRTPSEDVEVGGQRIRAGEQVATWLPSANRDESLFRDPERFDASRAPNAHLTFGSGPHHCLGSALARTELRVFFSELCSRACSADVVGPIRRLASNLIWGFESVPVMLDPR